MSPYENSKPSSFWKMSIANKSAFEIDEIYSKRFEISFEDKIATAGSCFAQNIQKYLKLSSYNLYEVEKAPLNLPKDLHASFGYSLFSARYGNIYTVAQLLQLILRSLSKQKITNNIWRKDNRYYDAFRPNIEPLGFKNENELIESRMFHLSSVKKLFSNMDILVFTLGLTETWINKKDGTVYPIAPGIIAGKFDVNEYEFKNFSFDEIYKDFLKVRETIKKIRDPQKKPTKFILTVSPVPLTATASDKHVLVASTYSKSLLRAVAGELYKNFDDVDYFPSFEIITNPASRGIFYDSNLRTVNVHGVETAMKSFFSEHQSNKDSSKLIEGEIFTEENKKMLAKIDNVCEEQVIEDNL